MKKSKWVLVFNLLVVYIFIQFVWWSVLIAHQLKQIYGDTPLYNKKLWMILGEGFVFAVILIAGIYFVRKSVKREMEVNRQQKNFLLAVTHELKTPIAVSKLSLQTIANRQLDPERQKEIISKALAETDRLNTLIDTIILGVKIDENNLELKTQKINLGDLVKQQVETLYHTIGTNHKLELNIHNDCFAAIDPHYFPSVISNLYENAIKYTELGSTIGIELTKKQNKVELVVWDNGKGIAEADRNRIFERFYRGGNEETRTAKGTGLGLFITRELVNMHNGTITCMPNNLRGTRFVVLLPSV
ncbi:MAG TPA: HAMP domain-containing sensor histidine kinase [Flavobacteriales bacterium]|nr:HAMP domain-containing sensor histidine kinase [Flavobacteriales bacterium]